MELRRHAAKIAAVLGACYVLVVGALVAGPWGWELNRFTVWLYVLFRYHWPIAPDWALPEHYGILLNVVLFVPLGAWGVALTRWPWWAVTLVAALASTGVELIQLLWLDRVGEVGDVVANTIGALVGAAAVTLRRRLR